LNQGKKERTDR